MVLRFTIGSQWRRWRRDLWMCVMGVAVCCAPGMGDGRLQADDWPQWMGPRRDGVWRESGILKQFPDSGLPVKWRVKIEGGYAGPAIVGDKVVVLDFARRAGDAANDPESENELSGTERVLCVDAKSGKPLWEHPYECSYKVSYPAGPRATPTIDGTRVYALGTMGHLHCLDLNTGQVLWKKDLCAEYSTDAPHWGFAAHPLVYGQLLICLVGGEGSIAVAFDKESGKEVWRSLSTVREQGYCPPTLIRAGGKDQLLIWHPEAINSLDPQTGRVYWSQPLEPRYDMSITAPQQEGEYLFASGIGEVAALYRLDSSQPGAELVWRGEPKGAIYCANSTPLIYKGHIFGSDCEVGALCGVRLQDGKRLWQTFQPTSGGERRVSHGTAFLVRHEDRFFLMSETGDLILANLSADGYHEISRFHLLEPTGEAFGRSVVWSHPAFASRAVFARNDKELVCASLAE